MSALTEATIEAELRQAMKSRAAVEVSALRGLLAAIRNAGIERRGKGGLGEADLVQILRREIKQREEAIGFAEQAGRRDLVEKNRAEREVLERFLPHALGREEIEAAVERAYEGGANAIGPLIAKLKAEFGARLDPRAASEIVREFLKKKG
jgi:hypothetical protein